MFQTVCFDLDGTLIDSAGDIAASLNFVRAHYGLAPLPDASVRDAIGDGVRVLLERTLLHEVSSPLDEAVALYIAHQEDHCLDRTQLYEGVREALAQCSQFAALAVVSNKPTSLCIKILQGLSILQYFRACVGGDTRAGRKPSPGPVLRALEALGDRPVWDALMVGDSPADLQAGAGAGVATAAVLSGYRPAGALMECKPEIVLQQTRDITDHVVRGGGRPDHVYDQVGAAKFHELAAVFYKKVGADPRIRSMFPADLEGPAQRQAWFFIQFFGGPATYNERRGAPRLRMRHAPFPIDAAARDAWLDLMIQSVGEVGLPDPSRGIFLRYVTHVAGILVNQ